MAGQGEVQIKHLDKLSTLRRRLLHDDLVVVEDPDFYRGTVAGGVATAGTLGAIAVGEEIGVAAGADPYNVQAAGVAKATAPFMVKNPQSLVFYATNLSSGAGACAIALLIRGVDLDGIEVQETLTLQTTNATTQAKQSQLIYREVTSITLSAVTGTLQANPLLAIGHGVSLVDTTVLFRPRLAMSGKVKSRGQIQKLLDPNWNEVSLTTGTIGSANDQIDPVRKNIIVPVGTTLPPGTWRLYYSIPYSGTL